MGNNKGKLKRDKRNLERLFNQGRYADFLRGVEKEKLTEVFSQEIGKAWRAMARAAFTTPKGMAEFFSERRTLTSTPDLQDVRFLTLVEQFLDGATVTAEVAALKNLSPTSRLMAKRLQEYAEAPMDTGEIEALFTRFVTTPDKVTVKQLETATRFFQESYGAALFFVPYSFGDICKENLKGAVTKKRLGLDLGSLTEIDQQVKEAAEVTPASILNVFLAPLLWQLALLYENYCSDDPLFALEVAGATPYLSSLLAKDRWGEVEQLLYEDDLSELYEEDRRYVRKKIAAADFPEKIRLLRTLEATLQNTKEDDVDDFDDFDSFDDEPGPDLEETIRADYLFLYKDVLAELGRNREKLASREQRELTSTMGEILEKDFVAFAVEPRQCAEFFQAIAQAGFLNTKLALAALFIARPTGNRILRERAEHALTSLPPAVKSDIQWLFKYFGFMSYPTLAALTPVIRLLRDNEPMLELIADLVAIQVTRSLVENQMMNLPGFNIFQPLMSDASRNMKQEMSEFRRELKNFSDIKAFDYLFLLTESYPDGCVTEAGFRKILAAQYVRSGMVAILDKIKQLPLPPPEAAILDPQGTLINIERRATLDLVNQHFADLRSLPVESMLTLVELLEHLGARAVEPGFLVRLNALLQERRDMGELEVMPLIVRIDALIRKAAGKKEKKGKRK